MITFFLIPFTKDHTKHLAAKLVFAYRRNYPLLVCIKGGGVGQNFQWSYRGMWHRMYTFLSFIQYHFDCITCGKTVTSGLAEWT